MPVHIKNCGLKNTASIEAAARSGASYIGFVHHPDSPRHLPFTSIAALAAHMPKGLAQVVVMVDPAAEMLEAMLCHVRPHFLQLHRVHDPRRIAEIRDHTRIPIITALNVRGPINATATRALEAESAHLLFDAFHPTQEGGGGHVFDWELLRGLSLVKPWFLAGGLTAENVAHAIRLTGAPMVDVSSGIEESPGIKSPEKIAAFNAAVLQP